MVYSARVANWSTLLFKFLLPFFLSGRWRTAMDAKNEKTSETTYYKQLVKSKVVMKKKEKPNIQSIGGIVLYLACLISILLFIVSNL